MTLAILTKTKITVDGSLSEWTTSDQINFGDGTDYIIFARAEDGMFYFGIGGPLAIGADTTAWFNTDRDATTGYQIFDWAGGAEYYLNINVGGSASLYNAVDGTLVLGGIQPAYSADKTSIEFAVPMTALGSPAAIDTLYDINNSVFLPTSYSSQPYTVFSDTVTRTDLTHRIGIVYSATTAANYFSATAYADLFMSVQNQAMQAGISYDLLTEADLTDLAKLANYDALVFPSFANVQAADVTAISNTLEQATRQFGVGLITSGNFMTNNETGAALAGDSYARMKLLFDATRVTGGTGDVAIYSSDTGNTVFTDVAPGALIHSYTAVGWDAFTSVSGTGQTTIATETVGGQTYTAALATQTAGGGKNVLFSTAGVMADSNLLWQAINYVAKEPGISISLALTRFNGIVASRTDMDQAMESEDVNNGIYDRLLPILAQWKQTYNFVGSYYVDIGNNQAQGQFTDWAISAPYYAQLLAMGNELGTHSYTHPEDTNVLSPAQIQFQFEESKLLIEQQMSAYLGHPFTIAGAAVPGMPEFLPTSQQVIQYFDYITGGSVFVGSGYPGAFGFLTPDQSSVYLAPNMSFDFTFVDFQHLGSAGAELAWAAEWNALVANANTPIVVWPWHDYGPTQWSFDGVASNYSVEMYTNFIARAYNAGDEFVILTDLAARIQSFALADVTSTVSGNVISVTVASGHAGDFALDVSGQGSQLIQNVANWYAYDSDSLFLPETGGSYTITLGSFADDVTHITALPMRGDLLSVTGDGLNLSFSMFGEGEVVIDLGAHGNMTPVVSGATIYSLNADRLELTLTGLVQHAVSLVMAAPAPTELVSTVSFSADSGSSTTDFVTNVASQTISGTLSAALAAGNVVKVSLDNGTTWLSATAAVGATTFSLAGVTLTASGTLLARVENTSGQASTALVQSYVLDQAPPAAPTTPDLIAASDKGASTTDNITNVTTPTFTGTAEAGSTVTMFDGATIVGTGVATAGTWTIAASKLTDGTHSITAQAADVAGNIGSTSATLSVTIDTAAPTAPTALDLVTASDSGVSNTDNITKVTTPTYTGSAEIGSTVTLFNGATEVGKGTATDGTWTITPLSALTNGTYSITAKTMDVAGNLSPASGILSVTVNTTAPAAPTTPDMQAASDTGLLSTDNITGDTTPTFTGKAEAGSTVTLFDGTTEIGTGVATDGTWTITASTLPVGVHSITAKATDVAGNLGAASGALSVVIDGTPPPAPTTPDLVAASDKGASNTDNITNVTTPTFTGTAEIGSTVTLFDGPTPIGTGKASLLGQWTITASTLPNGPHSITAKTTDAAGNLSTASGVLSVTIDTIALPAPTAPDLLAASDSGVSTDNITSDTTPTFTGTADIGARVILYDGATAVGNGVATDGTWTITASALPNGIHTITAKTEDLAGNPSVASEALLVTIDTTIALPTVPDLVAASDSGVSTDNITNVATPTFTGTAEAGATVTLYDGTKVIGTGVATAGKWTITPTLIDGTHSVTAAAMDVAGNISAASGKLSVTIDTLPPGAGAFTGLTVNNQNSATLAGKSEAGSTVTLLNGMTTLGTTTAGTGGNWSLKFATGSVSATSLLTAIASDAAGNKSPTFGSLLLGTSGADTLTSTAGNDILVGRGGADTFSFAATFGQDIIADFAVSGTGHDIINFHAISVLDNFANVKSHASNVGSGVLITLDANNTLTLNNVSKASLTSADFTFV
jgi:hypothetical protein